MSVDGVALATVISNAVSAGILFVILLRSDGDIRIDPGKLRVNKKILMRILRIGIPAGIQGMIFSLANIIIQSAINSLGTTVISASAAAFNVEIVAYYVVNAFGQACTTFTGQNYGAGNTDRCKKVLKWSIVLALLFTAASCGIILLFGKQILHLFTAEDDIVDTGYIRLVYIFSSYLFSLLVEVMSGYLR